MDELVPERSPVLRRHSRRVINGHRAMNEGHSEGWLERFSSSLVRQRRRRKSIALR